MIDRAPEGRHIVPPLRGCVANGHGYPGLTPWANLCRPFGAVLSVAVAGSGSLTLPPLRGYSTGRHRNVKGCTGFVFAIATLALTSIATAADPGPGRSMHGDAFDAGP